MKLIVYAWGSNSDSVLETNLINLGYDVVSYTRKCEHYTKDLKMAQEVINLIHESGAQAIVSFDYFPIISMVCNTAGIPYYSWIYDCPHYTLFAKTAGYVCNRIGCFDRALVERLNALGLETIKHLPLGVDWPDIRVTEDKYKCDISFVGSLYTGDYDYYSGIDVNDSIRERTYKFVNMQCFDYQHDHIRDFFNISVEPDISITDWIRNILTDQKLLLGDEYIEDEEYIFASSFMEKRVTIEERKRLLSRVASLGRDFRLYTGSKLDDEPELKQVCKGYIDYKSVMPRVFKSSRVNLNLTLRSIRTGIPLRALDIMGCGGFLLSNYQEELAENFKDGKEVVMFYSLDDCIDKIEYYLEHEDERRTIAEAGCRAVRERLNLKKQLKKLLMM